MESLQSFPLTNLRCVECHAGLERRADCFICIRDPSHRFFIVAGKLVCMRADNPDFSLSRLNPTFRKPLGWLNRAATFRAKHHSTECFKTIEESLSIIQLPQPRPWVLVIGGGEVGIGMQNLVRNPRLQLLETDIYVGSRTQIVCDGHELPFVDGVFDTVICQSVLEHVRAPQKVASEAQRVLKRDGLLFVQASFMQQVHEGRSDYFRFSARALRLMFDECEVLRWGASLGAATSLVWSIRYLLRAMLAPLPGGRLFSYFVYCLLLPVSFFLDSFLTRSPLAVEAASEIFLLMRKQDSISPETLDRFPSTPPG